jgi:hypothetical protein
MRESYKNKQSIRVLRAANKDSIYAPRKGIRYDGLYSITGQEILDMKTAMYRFSLERITGQDPIRYKGVERRPTDQELQELEELGKILE